MKNRLALVLGPLAFIIIQLSFLGNATPIVHVFAVLAWMLIWWITEVVHLAVTALLPMILFPLLNVNSIKEVTANYSHPIVFLFFGGFILALAIEKWNLHKRIALNIILKTGVNARQVLLGFMLATAFLSMWISNTATTIMMLPIALSVLNVIKVDKATEVRVGFILLVSLAWSANIGGMMTLIGTPPNLILAGFYKDQMGVDLSFANWLIVGLPTGLILFAAIYFIMSRFLPKAPLFKGDHLVKAELQKLGKMGLAEKRVALVFFATALAWIFRQLITQIKIFESLTDTGIALICAVTLFIIPNGEGGRILVWKDTSKLAWGILILFGGGLALANAISSSGMMDYIEIYFAQINNTQLLLLVAVMALIGIFATELISNMALVAAVLPLVLAVSHSMGIDFINLAVPLTLGASCAFMFPMATPPNAIVFSSGLIKIEKMARFGLLMNLVSFVIITILTYYLAGYVV